jgi:hypothetical protein
MILAALTALTLVPCEPIRIMDEGPYLSGTRTVCVAVSPSRSRILEDPSDYEWSYVKLDGRLVGIPPDARHGTWNP